MSSRTLFRPMFSTPVKVLLLLLAAPFPAAAVEPVAREQVLEWAPVEGASYYRIELFSGDEPIADAETDGARYVTFLPPGVYRYRIIVLNKFHKPVSESGWRVLTVLEALQPAVRGIDPPFLYSNNGGVGRFVLEIVNLEKDAALSLVQETYRIPGEFEPLGEDRYRVVFTDPRLGKPGIFTLEVVNPSGLKDLSTDRIAVRDIEMPEVDSLFPSAAHKGDILAQIPLSGWGFSPKTRVRFKGAMVWEPSEIFFESTEKLLLNLDLRDVPPGLYSLEVENPSGLRSEKWGFFTVVDPEIVELEKLEIDPKTGKIRKRRQPGKISGVAAGYHYTFLRGSLDPFYSETAAGANIRTRLAFRNDFFQRYPVLRQMALDLGVSYTHFQGSEYGDYRLQLTAVDLCLFYKTPFPFFINGIIKGGAGVTFTSLAGNGILGVFDSHTLDFQLMAAAGAEISLGEMFFLECGVMGRWQILLSGDDYYLQPYALFGLYF